MTGPASTGALACAIGRCICNDRSSRSGRTRPGGPSGPGRGLSRTRESLLCGTAKRTGRRLLPLSRQRPERSSWCCPSFSRARFRNRTIRHQQKLLSGPGVLIQEETKLRDQSGTTVEDVQDEIPPPHKIVVVLFRECAKNGFLGLKSSYNGIRIELLENRPAQIINHAEDRGQVVADFIIRP